MPITKEDLEQFWKSVKAGDTEKVEGFLNQGITLDIVDERNENALHVAAQAGQLKMIQFLVVEKQMDVNATNSDVDPNGLNGTVGETALEFASKRPDLKMMQFLVNNGANIERFRDKDGSLLTMVSRNFLSFDKADCEDLAKSIIRNMLEKDQGKLLVEDFGLVAKAKEEKAVKFLFPLIHELTTELDIETLVKSSKLSPEDQAHFASYCKPCELMGWIEGAPSVTPRGLGLPRFTSLKESTENQTAL